jgi:RNA polymerase sigma-70 factor (ECF subfamily)
VEAENERLLVDRLRAGQPGAFDRAYARHKGRLYAFLMRLSGRRDVTEDLFQETFLKLARFAPTLREDTDLPAWLFTVARNAYRSHRRWAALDLSRLVALDDDTPHADAGPLPDVLTEGVHRARALERALGRVSVASREALLLVAVEGFDQERAAGVVGVTYAAFRQRLARARAELEQEMEREERRAARRTKESHGISR